MKIPFFNKKKKTFFKWILLALLLGLFGLGFKFVTIIYANYQEAVPRVIARISNIMKNTALSPFHTLVSYVHPIYNEELEDVRIDISFKNWNKLEKKAEKAVDIGVLISDEDDWVKGSFSSGKDEYKVKLRLKGDRLDHIDMNKPSLRLKISNSDAWNGMNTFSLQSPKTRNFLAEWLLLQVERSENILAPRYDFVNMTLNGRRVGVMAAEEFFAKQMIESMGRRESPILKFN